jgi:hypothetical protein
MTEILPESQAYSDAIMKVRLISLELKEAALEACNKQFILQDKLMKDGKTKMFAMYGGDIEEGLMELATQHGKAKKLHTAAQALGNKLGIVMPEQPSYAQDYIGLAGKKVDVLLTGKELRR